VQDILRRGILLWAQTMSGAPPQREKLKFVAEIFSVLQESLSLTLGLEVQGTILLRKLLPQHLSTLQIK
jgi:hypothetical protein